MRLIYEWPGRSMPRDSNAHMQAALYHKLAEADATYAHTLHNSQGVKLFTWASMPARLIISSPLQQFVMTMMQALHNNPRLHVRGMEVSEVGALTTQSDSELHDEVNCICLSPIVLSVKEHGRRWNLPPDDARVEPVMRRNLVRKYEALFGKPPASDELSFAYCANYLGERQQAGKRVTRLIPLKSGGKLRGVVAPFRATGNAELIRVGMSAGWGEKGAVGCGLAQIEGSRLTSMV